VGEGRIQVSTLIPGRLDEGGTIEFRCCLFALCSDPLEILYVPEPPGQTGLGVGLIALAFLARIRGRRWLTG
jgi:MYXO-CTERM domain-containing protein